MRAAWRWAQEHDRFDDLVRAVEGLGTFYEIKGWFADAREIFSQTVEWLRPRLSLSGTAIQDAAVHKGDVRQILLARLLAQQGWFLARAGLHQQARRAVDTSIALLAPLGDHALREQALAQTFLGDIFGLAANPAAAIAPYERSFDLFTQIGDRYGMGLPG